MSVVVTCEHFFDGVTMHGARRVTYENGAIVAIEPFDGIPDHHVISPGFVDIQMNGFEQWDVARSSALELRDLGNRLQELGTTTWLGTITTAPLDSLSRTITTIDTGVARDEIPGCVGIHVEGPFLGAAPGAHNPSWIIPVDKGWIQQLPANVRLVTLAAEQEDVVAGISLLREKGIAVSIGHSRPNVDQWKQAREAGATLVTHLFNGMSGIHHREEGLALMALNDRDVFTGLIGDLVHVSPEAVLLAFTVKGDGRVCLVSDTVGWSSSWAQKREIEIRDGSPRLPNGTLAGSSTSLAECVRRVVTLAGVPLEQALRAATSAPADAIGLSSVGRLSIGQPADFVALDNLLYVTRTWSRLVSLRG
jgi:N-acetylglucosamine-6-phosphate deacetylase